jgi:hypothetical protein
VDAATCKGGGFFLFGSWDLDPPCCGAIPKHLATRQDLSTGFCRETFPQMFP